MYSINSILYSLGPAELGDVPQRDGDKDPRLPFENWRISNTMYLHDWVVAAEPSQILGILIKQV